MSPTEGYSKCTCHNCGGHIEFPSAGAGQTIPCPHCNWPTTLVDSSAPIGGGPATRKKIFKLFFISSIIVIAAGAGVFLYLAKIQNCSLPWHGPVLAPSGGNPTAPPLPNAVPAKPIPPPDPWRGLMASPVTLEKVGDGRLIYAVGTLTNTSDHERYGVRVQLDVLNAAADKLSATTDYKDSILPGKYWKFKALVTDPSAASARITSVKEN